MKISQKQASILAAEIVKQLKAKKVQKVPETTRQQLKAWMEKRSQLMAVEKEAEEVRRKFDTSIKNIVGKNNYVEAFWSVEKIIEKMEEKNIPRISEIEDEIILKSMFKSEVDMETFVNSIVKKYEKKLQSKVLSN